MTSFFSDMLYMLSYSIHDKEPIGHKIKDLKEVLIRAKEQGILQLIYPAADKIFKQGNLEISEEVLKNYRHTVMSSVASNANRKNIIHNLLCDLREKGIEYCILKGEVLALLYPDPQLRISSDTDIYVGKDGYDKALEILKEHGFSLSPIGPTSHHDVAKHSIGGIVELHHQLYDTLIEDIWFENKALLQEPYIDVRVDTNMLIPTLGITDGIVFVALHYIKHFLEEGVGIRQMTDMLLYMKHYREKIDWNRFNSLMIQLKYNKFIDHSIGIGKEYLGFDKDDLPFCEYDKQLLVKILSDCEQGGVFGQKEYDRKGFYLQYTKQRFGDSNSNNYNEYIKKWWKPMFFKLLFPHPKNLEKKFPYLKKTPILYPIAWFHRIIRIFIGIIKGNRKAGQLVNPTVAIEENPITKRRMELVKELEML